MLNLKFFLSEELVSMILDPKVKSIFLLGGPDTGKTTFIECLIELLKDNFSLGIVDCDMGQSHIGPPATIAWAKVLKEFNFWQDLKLEDFYFAGSLSPSGNIQRTLEGVKFIYGKAKQNSDKVIIDTTGYIFGFEAVDFKIKKIRIIQPDLIVTLYKEDELKDILDELKDFSIFRITVPGEIKLKSQTARALYRDKLFKDYFSSCYKIDFPEDKFKRLDEKDLEIEDRLVSLQDKENKDLALGIIKERKNKEISVLTPLKKPERVSQIIVGLCKWQGI